MRYFLEEGGCSVVAMTSGGLETIHVAAEERPDVLVLHERIAAEEDVGYVAAVHEVSPLTNVVVVTSSPEEAWSGPARGADMFLLEWIGIQDLEFVLNKLHRPVPSESAQVATGLKRESAAVGLATLNGGPNPTSRTPPRQKPGDGRRPGRTWIAAAAAALILLVLFLGSGLIHIDRQGPKSSTAATASLRNVHLALAVLVSKIRAGAPPEEILDAARSLSKARAAAIRSGADISDLDDLIASQLSPLLTRLPHRVASAVGVILPRVPILRLPGKIKAEATSPGGAIVTYSAHACSHGRCRSTGVICTPGSGSLFSLGPTSVACSLTETRFPVSGVFDVLVQDTIAPTLALSNATAEATGPDGAVVIYAAEASDTVDGTVVPACSPASGATFLVGSTTVTCSATDSHGNTHVGSLTVDVQDSTAPDLNLPADRNVEATGPAGAAVDFSTSATDLVDGSVPVTCDATSGDTFPLGTTTVNCSATDTHGNPARDSFTISVGDTTPPDLNLPQDRTAEATGPNGAAVDFSTSATDLVDGSVPVTCDATSGDTFPLGTTTVNCSATDAHGNTARGSFNITVVDTTAPAIDAHPDITVTAQDIAGAVVNYTPPATHDVVDGDGVATCSPLQGTTFPIGDTIVTCTATDATGNHATPTTFVVHVITG
jgi:hypothetical protein